MQAAFCLILILISPLVAAFAQTTNISGQVNIYVPVTAVDLCENRITVESSAGFAVGDRVLIIQMNGVAVDTTSTSGFGSITDYGNVGHYEFAIIGSITGRTIAFRHNLLQTYDATGALQLIRVPVYTDADVVGTLTAPLWNGRTGGVLAIDVTGTLSLHADIDVTRTGFRGGPRNILKEVGNCGALYYYVDQVDGLGGEKGGGVGPSLPAQFTAGRGAIANGAGGGNPLNSGGGGGGNGGAGGHGGAQWLNCAMESDTVINTGGFGGYRLDSTLIFGRIFLGGGGGGGHDDNTTGTDGTNGGGIIIIRAGAIDGNGHAITADGSAPLLPAELDGGGGGGAGGSIMLDAAAFLSSVTLSAAGAIGSDTRHIPEYHGPGGGGGGGVIGLALPSVPSILSVDISGGEAGRVVAPDITYGATAGEEGIVATGVTIPEGKTLYRTPQVSIGLPTIVADPGDTISIPVTIATAKNIAFTGATGYRIAIRFNRHLLRPIGSTPQGMIVGDDRIYELNGPVPDTSIVPAVFRFLVLLGPVDTTTLSIDTFAWDGTLHCPIEVLSRQNGFVTVNTCRTGDTRLIDSGPAAMLRAVYPNPANATVELDYTLLEDGPTRIFLVDINGREVALLRDDIASPGDYVLTFDTSSLPDGVYRCVLQTPTGRFSQAVHIQR